VSDADPHRRRALFERALARDPTDAATRVRYGRLLVEAFDDRAAANEQFERAAALDPTHPGARNALAVRALRAGDVDGARERLAAVLADEPDDPERATAYARAWTNHANLLWRAGDDPEGARGAFETALERDPTLPRTHAWLGRLLAEAFDDAAGARERYERAVALDPEHAPAHVGLGNLRWRAADPEGALSHHERAVAADPESALAQYNLGTVRLDGFDDPEGAREALERAVALDPARADARRKLGEALWRAGDADGAREAFAAALERDPDDETARVALAALASA